jgi:hypothetical protein
MNAVNEKEPVSPQNAVLLLVDQQEGLFARIHQPERTRSTWRRWPAAPGCWASRRS